MDKSFYMTGDMIWFKAYVVDGSSHRPADLNKVAYVELLDTMNHHNSWTIGVYNLTGGRNAYPTYFTAERGAINGYKWLPRFFPVI